ncbi:MAG: hypothetical protein HYY02_08200 [Chloroflexi bacterium]|nr:hypothetical protein [Chloroflexota bacterium]
MQFEWLILADAAQIVGGKLFLLGGGWDVLTINGPFPLEQRFALAAAFRVPWHETNQPHQVELEIVDVDGGVLGRIEGNVEVGRPPGTLPGQDQRAQLAADVTLRLEKAGIYAIIGRIRGQEEARVTFRVVAGPR